jgi:hypothetical protein
VRSQALYVWKVVDNNVAKVYLLNIYTISCTYHDTTPEIPNPHHLHVDFIQFLCLLDFKLLNSIIPFVITHCGYINFIVHWLPFCVTYSSYSFGEYLLLLLLISWGSHPKFCFERVTLICPPQILLKHWALPQKSSSPWPPFILDKKCGTIGNILGNTLGTWWEPHCEHAIKGFKKFENYSLDLEQEGFPLKKIKPRPKKSSKNQEPPNTRYYEHTIIAWHSSLFHMTQYNLSMMKQGSLLALRAKAKDARMLCLDSL